MKICTTCGQEWPDEQKFCPNDGSALRSAGKTADLVGSVIAERYHITKKLGEGGMGAVYLGEHVKMGRKSAIKVMSQSMANDPDSIARFNREAANAARITHPNVCAIYDFGETPDGVIYLAMEFIEGEALTDLIEREGALSAQRAVKILRQAGEALQTAHDMGIVHRDLKPDNIMIARGREGDVVKVVDFGIAKAMGGEEKQNVTKTGLVVGTPEYMSPEQLSGDKLDGRSDIYSLGLVFFRMLTGDLPFQADSAQEVMIKRLTDEPLPLNDVVPGGNFPDALQQVIDRALARMPSERYDSAAQFALDAEAAVAGMAPAAADTEGATQLLDAGDVAQTAALARTRVAGKAAKTRTPDTPQPQPSPPPDKARKPNLAIAAGVVVALAAAGVGGYVAFGGGDAPPDTNTVTQDTAQAAAANDPQTSLGGTPPQGRNPGQTSSNPGSQTTANQPETTAVPAAGALPDSATVARELQALAAATDPDSASSPSRLRGIVARANEIYDEVAFPRAIRHLAAETAAFAYIELLDTSNACRWLGLAARLLPPSEQDRYDRTRNSLGCQ